MATALVVLDMQVSLLEDETPNMDEIMSAVFRLAERARDAGAPIIWVLDKSIGPDGALHAVFQPEHSEVVVRKSQCNAFYDTPLADELGGRGATRIVVCGMQSDACIEDTVRAAPAKGFDVTLVSDAHTTHSAGGRDFRDVVAEVNRLLGRVPGVTLAKVEDIEFEEMTA